MQDADIINLWKSYDQKLEQNLALNRKNAEEITRIKIGSFLSSMKPLKVFILAAGFLWILFLDTLIVNLFPYASIFFLVSAGILSILNKLAVGLYLYQLILIHQVDISEPILSTQQKLASLKSTTLWIARILFLQLPLWTTFYWNKSMIEHGTILLWTVQLIITLSFAVLAIWLFFTINYAHRDKWWFKLIFNGGEWNPVIKAIGLLSEIEEFKKEVV